MSADTHTHTPIRPTFHPRASGRRVRSYAFGGRMARIGIAVHGGQLPVAVDEVTDELVALF